MTSAAEVLAGSLLGRRGFIKTSALAAGGLMVSLYLDPPAAAQDGAVPPPRIYPPDAFVQIRADGKIVITVNRLEVGQGAETALPMILADELDADWSQVIAELAPAGELYKDPVIGVQMIGGSCSISNSFQQYRELGARTRSMLIAAAADRWSVPADQCRTEHSVVYGPGNRSARYAELAEGAVRRPVPAVVQLKSAAQFRLIGKPVRRLDSRAKCDGSQTFGLDLDLPGMLIALLARPPVFGGRVRTFDDRDARTVAGVRDIFEIPLVSGSAIAVVADRFWAAKQARDRLKVDWDVSGVEHPDSVQLSARYKELARTTGNVAVSFGDPQAIDRIPASDRIQTDYAFPYLAHAAMEPLNLTVRNDGDRAEAWVPSQIPTWEQAALAEVLGIGPERVTYHVLFAGGSFGRRGTVDSHFVREAAAIAKRVPGRPVKLIYTREDDMTSGYFRPMFVHRVEVGIGPSGTPLAWKHVIVGQSFVLGTGVIQEALLVKNGVDQLATEGIDDSPYALPNIHLSVHHPKVNVPTLSHRSVGYGHNSFVRETLIDELAARAKADPIAYRLKLLKPEAKRFRSSLTLLDQKSAWRHRLPRNHASGIACSAYHDTCVSCAVEVSIVDRRPRIHRATVAVDCGLAVNPLSIEHQMQGGLVFGLTQLMTNGAMTLKDGRVQQRNFDGYTPPYMKDAPEAVDVHIVPSDEPPTGCGEAPVPVIAPAVANALFRLTGTRYRTLPLAPIERGTRS
jgi:isoquinoline 1-oxidoreductase subunit beta